MTKALVLVAVIPYLPFLVSIFDMGWFLSDNSIDSQQNTFGVRATNSSGMEGGFVPIGNPAVFDSACVGIQSVSLPSEARASRAVVTRGLR